MKQKILMINTNQFGYTAAHHYYCKYLKDVYDIDYVCIDKKLKKLEEPGINVIYLPYIKNRLLRLINFISYVVKKSRSGNYDYLYVVFFKGAFLIGLFGAAKIKILDIRTCSISDNFIGSFLYNKLNWVTCFFFHRIIVINKDLIAYLNLPVNKTYIVPLGADILDPTEKTFDRMFMIYIGTLHKRNIEKTILGLYLFIKKYKIEVPLKYRIIGFGIKNEEKTIIQTINNLKLNNIVSYIGIKHHRDLIKYLKDSTIGVCFVPKKRYYEMLPSTKLFEYGLSGLILLGTNTRQNRIYINEYNGVLCEDNAKSFCDSLKIIYDRLKYYNSQIIRNQFKIFAWPLIVKNYLIPVLTMNEKLNNLRNAEWTKTK